MADTETTTMNIAHDVRINGELYRKGERVVVPKSKAQDIDRMNHDYTQQLLSLNKKRVFSHDAGTIAVGSGAE